MPESHGGVRKRHETRRRAEDRSAGRAGKPGGSWRRDKTITQQYRVQSGADRLSGGTNNGGSVRRNAHHIHVITGKVDSGWAEGPWDDDVDTSGVERE